MIGDIIAGIVELVAGGIGQNRIDRRLERGAHDEGRVRGSLRISLGEAPGLSRRWRSVEVEPLAGAIVYDRQRLAVQRAFLRSEPMALREELKVPMVTSPVVIDLHVPGASLEWAVSAQDADRVLDALRGDG